MRFFTESHVTLGWLGTLLNESRRSGAAESMSIEPPLRDSLSLRFTRHGGTFVPSPARPGRFALFGSFGSFVPEGFVASFGFGIGRVKAGQRRSGLHLTHNPRFQLFLLGRCFHYIVEQGPGDDDGAIFIHYDDIIWKHRYPAAANRLLPIDEG